MDIQEKIQKGGTMNGTGTARDARAGKAYSAEARKSPVGLATAGERGDEDRFGYRLPGGPARLGAARVAA